MVRGSNSPVRRPPAVTWAWSKPQVPVMGRVNSRTWRHRASSCRAVSSDTGCPPDMPAALHSIRPSRGWTLPVSSAPASCRDRAVRWLRSQVRVSSRLHPGRKSKCSVRPSPPVAAWRDRSNTAGPLTPYSVNSSSPWPAASVSPSRVRVRAAWAFTPLRPRG